MKVDPTYERNLEIHLHGPGPSDVPTAVLRAISAATIGHLDSECRYGISFWRRGNIY